MDSSNAQLFSTVLLFLTISTSNLVFAERSFNCSRPTGYTCNALIDYVPPNATTLSHIMNLFTITDLRSILGANNLPPSTSPNLPVPANQTIKIRFPCICNNSFGVSNQIPIYTVVKDDWLDHIASEVFSRLVSYQQIQESNGLPDATIIPGQKLHIPLPCSCDEVDGQQVVHYGHVVAPGSSMGGIAQQYNTSQETLQRLNNLKPQDLQAYDVLDVPLRACSSSVNRSSLDYPLLVSNGTYVFTSRNCVLCNCDASISWKLQCHPSQIDSPKCSPTRCAGAGNLNLGNTTTSGCNRTTCAYAGFVNQTILTTLDLESTCPASGNGSTPSSAIRLRGGCCWRWDEVLAFVNVLLLGVSLIKWT